MIDGIPNGPLYFYQKGIIDIYCFSPCWFVLCVDPNEEQFEEDATSFRLIPKSIEIRKHQQFPEHILYSHWHLDIQHFIGLVYGKIYRKTLHLMVKNNGFLKIFP